MRRVLAITLSATLGCTSSTTLGPGALAALAHTTTNDTLELPDKNGMVVEITPNATISFPSSSTGPPEDVPASDIYSSVIGLHRSNGDLIMQWGDTRTVKVEQFDGAATVAVTATAAILIVVIAAFLKSAPSSTPSSVPKGGSGSSGHAPNVPTRSAPSAPTSGSGLDAEALARAAELTMELAANASGNGPGGAIVLPPPPDPPSDEPPPVLVPLFSSSARRRANIRAIARLDGGACWFGEGSDCAVAGARVGVRLIDFFEFAFGVRTESTSAGTRALAIGSAMMHGELPAAHWFALALGANIAFDGVRAEVIPAATVRFRPVRGLWLGVSPVAPIYATDTGKWVMSSNVEITGEL